MPSLTEIVEGVVAGIAVLGAGAHTLASKKSKREKGEEEDGEKARTRDGKFLLGEIIRERGQWKALRKEQRSLAARIEDLEAGGSGERSSTGRIGGGKGG